MNTVVQRPPLWKRLQPAINGFDGLLSLAMMLGQGVAARTLANVRFLLTDWAMRLRSGQGSFTLGAAPLQTTAARLPYALAIAVGTVAALVQAH